MGVMNLNLNCDWIVKQLLFPGRDLDIFRNKS